MRAIFTPLLIDKVTEQQAVDFNKFYLNSNIDKNKFFMIEGLWFRTQEKANKELSGWKKPLDKRRRIFHSMKYFNVSEKGDTKNLVMSKFYFYLCISLPKQELDEYYNSIILLAKDSDWLVKEYENEVILKKNGIRIELRIKKKIFFDEKENRYFPDSYEHLEVYIVDKSTSIVEFENEYHRIWELYRRGLRPKGMIGKPTVIQSLEEIKEYLPVQIEVGCGPSIESNIPALDSLHEIFKVQNKNTHKFYLGKDDDFIHQIIKDSKQKLLECAEMPLRIVKSSPAKSHKIISELASQGIVVGPILSNNFDKLFEKVGLEEILVRKYEYDQFYPKIKFDDRAKSLLVIGCHADRRQIQLQARIQGLKIIHINPGGYLDSEDFRSKEPENVKEEDFILINTAESVLHKFQHEFIKSPSII